MELSTNPENIVRIAQVICFWEAFRFRPIFPNFATQFLIPPLHRRRWHLARRSRHASPSSM